MSHIVTGYTVSMQALNLPRVTVFGEDYVQAKNQLADRGNKMNWVNLGWWVKLSVPAYVMLHEHLKQTNTFLLCRLPDKDYPNGEVMVVERIHMRKEGKGVALRVEARSPVCVDYRNYKKHPLPSGTPQLIGLRMRFG